MQGNTFAPLALNRILLPAMLRQGGGAIIYITSGAAYDAPPAKAGQGGRGLSCAHQRQLLPGWNRKRPSTARSSIRPRSGRARAPVAPMLLAS